MEEETLANISIRGLIFTLEGQLTLIFVAVWYEPGRVTGTLKIMETKVCEGQGWEEGKETLVNIYY